jgi:hypothetical protein
MSSKEAVEACLAQQHRKEKDAIAGIFLPSLFAKIQIERRDSRTPVSEL